MVIIHINQVSLRQHPPTYGMFNNHPCISHVAAIIASIQVYEWMAINMRTWENGLNRFCEKDITGRCSYPDLAWRAERLKNATVFIAGAGGLGSPVATILPCRSRSNYSGWYGCGRSVQPEPPVLPGMRMLVRKGWKWSCETQKVKSGDPDYCSDVTMMKEMCMSWQRMPMSLSMPWILSDPVSLNKAACSLDSICAWSVWDLESDDDDYSGKTPCLSCLVHEAPPKEVFPVLGATPGVIGTLQVTEAIKLITGIGKPVLNRLLLYDGEFMNFHEVSIEKDPRCPVCGISR